MFYSTLEKLAYEEGNYYSKNLSRKQQLEAFKKSRERQAARETGTRKFKKKGRKVGAITGGLLGLGMGLPISPAGGVASGALGAVTGGVLGGNIGNIDDGLRDAATLEARRLLKDKKALRKALDLKRAERFDEEDAYDRDLREREVSARERQAAGINPYMTDRARRAAEENLFEYTYQSRR